MLDRRFLLNALAALLGATATDALARPKKKAAGKRAGGKKAAGGKGKKGKASRKTRAVRHEPPAPPPPPPPPPVPDQTDPAVKASLTAAFETILNDLLAASPLLTTSLGLDKGAFAAQKARIDDRSAAALNANVARLRKAVGLLQAIPRGQLSYADRTDYDTVLWDQSIQLEGAQAWTFGDNAMPMNTTFYADTPYIVSQMTGLYCVIPDFLDSQHIIANTADAQAYIARLDGFAAALDQETVRLTQDAARGIIPPDFIIQGAVSGLTKLRDVDPAQSVLINSIDTRTTALAIAGDWKTDATTRVTGPIKDALTRQIDALNVLLTRATHDAGVLNLPNGAAYYAYAARMGTSVDLTPKDIHTLGLQKVADINAELDARLRSLGKTQGSPGERMHALYTDPAQLYSNDDAGKAQLLIDLNAKVDKVFARLPGYFGTLPKTKVIIKRIPVATEAGQPGGYYQPAALDGSRPGTYYINLRDTAETPKFLLSTLTYHEAIPGHHLQISLQQEASIPLLRKVSSYNAYVEGWALYAEQLAGEMGMYDNDPFGRIGYLHDALFRAVRLVVDTGMHSLGWSREQAVTYMVDNTGDLESATSTEIERYCAWPGQALGYMVGKLTWLKIRDAMKAKAGMSFDIKKFHDTGLLFGSVPLAVLENIYADRDLT